MVTKVFVKWCFSGKILCLMGKHKDIYGIPYAQGINCVDIGTCSRCGRVVRKVTRCGHQYELKREKGTEIKKGKIF